MYVLLALLTMVLLGVHYFLAKILSQQVPSSIIALFSTLVTIPCLVGYVVATRAAIPDKAALGWTLLAGLPLATALITLYMAIGKGPVSVVMPIYGLNAMVTVFMGMLFLNETLSLQKIIGLVFAALAIIFLSR